MVSVTWNAPFQSGGGYSSEATAFLVGLSQLPDVKVSARQHGDSYNQDYMNGLPDRDVKLLSTAFAEKDTTASTISVCHSEPGAWELSPTYSARYQSGYRPCPDPLALIKVGRTMFESDRLPAGWVNRLNLMDEIWLPTLFAARIFINGGVIQNKIRIVPEAVDAIDTFNPFKVMQDTSITTKLIKNTLLPPARTSNNNVTRFLFVGKFERRKGIDILLAAFATAFFTDNDMISGGGGGGGGGGGDAKAELYVLTSAYHSKVDFESQIKKTFANLACKLGEEEVDHRSRRVCLNPTLASFPPKVHLLSGIDQASLPLVYASVDVLVQPSRGEGWGRPHVEAMSMGLPIIATLWSGPSAYLDDEIGYVLNHTGFSPILDGPFKDHLMCDPDTLSLVHIMREITANISIAREKGKKAREKMLQIYSPKLVASFISKQLHRLKDKAMKATRMNGGEEGMIEINVQGPKV